MNPSKPGAGESDADHEIERLFDEHEYSAITKRSLASVRRDRVQGMGCPYVKLGALVRYRPSDVRAHLERNLHSPDHKLGRGRR